VKQISLVNTGKKRELHGQLCVLFQAKFFIHHYESLKDATRSLRPEEKTKELKVKEKNVQIWCNTSEQGSKNVLFSLFRIMSTEMSFLMDFDEAFQQFESCEEFGLPIRFSFEIRKLIKMKIDVNKISKLQAHEVNDSIFEVPNSYSEKSSSTIGAQQFVNQKRIKLIKYFLQ